MLSRNSSDTQPNHCTQYLRTTYELRTDNISIPSVHPSPPQEHPGAPHNTPRSTPKTAIPPHIKSQITYQHNSISNLQHLIYQQFTPIRPLYIIRCKLKKRQFLRGGYRTRKIYRHSENYALNPFPIECTPNTHFCPSFQNKMSVLSVRPLSVLYHFCP